MTYIYQFFKDSFKEGLFDLVSVKSLDEIKEGVGVIVDDGKTCHAIIKVTRLQREENVIGIGGMLSMHQNYNPKKMKPKGNLVMGLSQQLIFDKEEVDKGTIYMARPRD